ncbi:MAG: hypothetical protein Tsb0010_18570 [Parvularculaceae bacterium]
MSAKTASHLKLVEPGAGVDEGEAADAAAPQTEELRAAIASEFDAADEDPSAGEQGAASAAAPATADADNAGAEDDAARAERAAAEKRMVEALLFAAAEPISEAALAERLPEGADIPAALASLAEDYAARGVALVQTGAKWSFRTAPDLGWLLERERVEPRKLSRAALETLAVIAYHQPVTRAEIEEIRGVSLSKGTLDILLEIGWVKMRGRKRAPGRPVTYGTSEEFLSHFGLASLGDLPGLEDLKSAGLLDGRLPPGFSVPSPSAELRAEEEDPLDGDEAELFDHAPDSSEGPESAGFGNELIEDAPLEDAIEAESGPGAAHDEDREGA